MLPMVVLDELGVADMSPEKPIKVLEAELERKSSYSVIVLSNWVMDVLFVLILELIFCSISNWKVVDAAQVNRGILISPDASQHQWSAEIGQTAGRFVNRQIRERVWKDGHQPLADWTFGKHRRRPFLLDSIPSRISSAPFSSPSSSAGWVICAMCAFLNTF